MYQEQTCQRHQKAKEYFCIEKSNQSNISFLCQDCLNEANFQKKQDQGKVFKFDNLLKQVDEFSGKIKTQSSDLNHLMKKFEQMKEKIERQLDAENDLFYKLQKGIRDLQHFCNHKAFPEFSENSSFQKAILNEEREDGWTNFSQQMQNEFKQFITNLDNFINSQEHRFNSVPYVKQQNKNDFEEQIQNNQQTKQIFKLKKMEEKQIKFGTIKDFFQQVSLEIEKEQQNKSFEQDGQPQKNQKISTTQQFQPIQPIQPQQQQQEPWNQQAATQDNLQQQTSNQSIFHEQIIYREKIRHILVINKNEQIVASKNEVRLCKNLKSKDKIAIIQIRIDKDILDIQLSHPETILIRTKENHLYCYSLQLQKLNMFDIELRKNKFEFYSGILYRYDNQTNELIKQRLGSNQQPFFKKYIKLLNDMKVVAIKIVDEQLHVGFSNGKVRHYKLSNFDQQQEYDIPKQEEEQFRLFYFESEYCIGVQKKAVYKKVYKPQIHINDDRFTTEEIITQCSYLIDHQNREIEIECLLKNHRVFIYKKKDDVQYRDKFLKNIEISCIQACPKLKQFYYGYIEGDFKCVKQRI
ncbi:unnamed protein product [Paramecium octaurelia]|uniref:Uncharacterized protein n=1 Tax=Paramecium octaurelia TaxID=43137 RepID=A0A8S1XJ36_PAROT|nr:unnamed protein product [Paramecium octaurelia]